jgi:putative hydrolase of HD superfamily
VSEAITDTGEIIEIEQGLLEAQHIARTVLQVSRLTIDFADIMRVPRYCPNRPENNAEHSFMLGLTAMAVGPRHYPGLDTGLMVQFALVHDLVELETGDVQTFQVTDEELQAKYAAEEVAVEKLCGTLPTFVADMLHCYEEQQLPEARLVRHLDKLLPYSVDLTGRDNAGMVVLREVYDTTTREQFTATTATITDRYRNMFPEESHQPIHLAAEILNDSLAEEFDS